MVQGRIASNPAVLLKRDTIRRVPLISLLLRSSFLVFFSSLSSLWPILFNLEEILCTAFHRITLAKRITPQICFSLLHI